SITPYEAVNFGANWGSDGNDYTFNGRTVTVSDQNDALAYGQSAYYLALMFQQCFNHFICKARLSNPWGSFMFQNKWSFAGVFGGGIFSLLIVYIPGINVAFLTNWRLTPYTWLVAMAWGLFLYLYAIVRVLIKRRFAPIKYTDDIPGLQMFPTRWSTGGKGDAVAVTSFPANHCAGSTMFLFEFKGKRVLYTGDLRADESLMNDFLVSSNIFKNAFGSMKQIDTVYIDTTFCDRRLRVFPSKNDSLAAIISAISRRPAATNYSLYLLPLGYEPIIIGLSKHFDTKIHIAPEQYALYASYAQCQPSPPDENMLIYVTQSSSKARFHFRCDCWKSDASMVTIKATTMPWTESLAQFLSSKPYISDLEDAELLDGFRICQETDRMIHVFFAMHSSFNELRALIREIKPSIVHPCVLDATSIFNNADVLSAFDDLLVSRTEASTSTIKQQIQRRKSAAELLLEELLSGKAPVVLSSEGEQEPTQSLDTVTEPLQSDPRSSAPQSIPELPPYSRIHDSIPTDPLSPVKNDEDELVDYANEEPAESNDYHSESQMEDVNDKLDGNKSTSPTISSPSKRLFSEIAYSSIPNCGATSVYQQNQRLESDSAPSDQSRAIVSPTVSYNQSDSESNEFDVIVESEDERESTYSSLMRRSTSSSSRVADSNVGDDNNEAEIDEIIEDSQENHWNITVELSSSERDGPIEILSSPDFTTPTKTAPRNVPKRKNPQLEVIDLTVSDDEMEFVPDSQPATPVRPAPTSLLLPTSSSSTFLSITTPKRRAAEVIDVDMEPPLAKKQRSSTSTKSDAVNQLDWVKSLSRTRRSSSFVNRETLDRGLTSDLGVQESAEHVRNGGQFVLDCTYPFKRPK
ncbi:hypothetical protein HDU79_011483, partial [Rhizoclosmatium sp. JEL0117]